MATLVLALAGLTAGSGAGQAAARARLTVNLAGQWRGTVQDDRGTHKLEWYDGEVKWRVGDQELRGKMQIVPDGRGKVRVDWLDFGFGRDANRPIPHGQVYRGTYAVQGDRLVLHLHSPVSSWPVRFASSPLRITLEPVAPSRTVAGVAAGARRDPDAHK